MRKQITLTILILVAFLLTSCSKEQVFETNILKEEYIDNILYAYNYHLNANYFKIIGEGEISSSLITQNIRLVKTRDENDLYYINASYGSKLGIKINNYVEVSGNFDNLIISKGATTKALEKDEKVSEEIMDHNRFISLYGVGLHEINYELSRESILSIAKEDDVYILELDLELAVLKYIKHINETNPYESKEDKTKFHSLTLKVKLDEGNRFKEIAVFESYDVETKVLAWVRQKLTAKIVEKYSYEKGESL